MSTKEAERIDAFIASRSGRPNWTAVPAPMRPRTPAEAYRLQREIYRRMEAFGQVRIGYKVGCTAPRSQAPFGLVEPIYAGIFRQSQVSTLERACALPLVAPAIECEVAFRMASDLNAADADDESKLVMAIATMYPACEIIDSRYGVPARTIGVPTLLTDDFLHAAFVLGDPVPVSLQHIRSPAARLVVDGNVFVDRVPGTLPPLVALRWLAKKLAENDNLLRSGDVVLTGSVLDPLAFSKPPEKIRIEIEGLGSLGEGLRHDDSEASDTASA